MVLAGAKKIKKQAVTLPFARKTAKVMKAKTRKLKGASKLALLARNIKGVRTVWLRMREKSSPMVVKVVKGSRASTLTAKMMKGTRGVSKANVVQVHLLLERRWLGLNEKAQRSSLSSRSMTKVIVEGWGIRVLAVYKEKANADKALVAAQKRQTEVEREGSLRERAQLMVKTYEVAQPDGTHAAPQRGGKGFALGKVYTVSSCIGENFSSKDLPEGLVCSEGNYFYVSAEAEDEASKSEEQRGTPWGYPHNASRPGGVLKVFSSPLGECGANAYATGQALKDVRIPEFLPLDSPDLAKAVSYNKDGLAEVKMLYAEKKTSVRVVLSGQEHTIRDYRTAVSGG